MFARIAIFVVLLALGAGCSENQPSLFDETILRPSSEPRLVDPSPGATAVSPSPRIQVAYEDVLDFSNVNPQNVRLVDLGPPTQTAVPIAITPLPDGRGFFIEPIGQLVAPRTHEVQINARAGGIRFADGNDIDDFSFRFTTAGDPVLVTASPLPDAQHDVSYSELILATGGAGTNSFSVTQGTLPQGLTLDAPSGRVFGVPQNTTGSTQTFQLTVTVTDSIGRTGSGQYSLSVLP